MRAAPAVSVSCSGGLSWRLMQALLPALAAAAAAAWCLQLAELAVGWAGPLSAAVFVVGWRRAKPCETQLRFDGAVWMVDGYVASVEVLIDVDRAMLLRCRLAGVGRLRHVALTAHEVGSSMHGLRVALYSPVSPASMAGR